MFTTAFTNLRSLNIGYLSKNEQLPPIQALTTVVFGFEPSFEVLEEIYN
jgi:hypothetical protein